MWMKEDNISNISRYKIKLIDLPNHAILSTGRLDCILYWRKCIYAAISRQSGHCCDNVIRKHFETFVCVIWREKKETQRFLFRSEISFLKINKNLKKVTIARHRQKTLIPLVNFTLLILLFGEENSKFYTNIFSFFYFHHVRK